MARRVVVDYDGMGNLRSVAKALEHVVEAEHRVSVTSQPDEILDANRLVFPGQRAARDCMTAISDYHLNRDNLFAVQFNPEKSADAGLTLLRNFIRWEPTLCC